MSAKLSDLTSTSSLVDADILYAVLSPFGSTDSRKITMANLRASLGTQPFVLTGDHAIGTASGNAYVQHSIVSGLVLYGHGTTNDITVANSSGTTVFGIPTATTTVRFGGIAEPSSNDLAALGSALRSWSDLFLASGAVLNFNNGNFTVTHSSALLTFSNATSTLYNTVRNTATATLTTVTQGLTLAGNLVTSAYTADGFTPGLVWSNTDDNASKPKAGIFSKTTGSGSYVIIGTSSSYVTGIVSTVSVGPAGEFDCGAITSTANAMTIAASSGNTILEIGNSTLTGTIAGIDFHFGVAGAQDFNVRVSNYADQSLAVTASSGVVLFGVTGKVEIYNTSDAQTLNIDSLSTTQDVINITNNDLTTGAITVEYSDSESTGTRVLHGIYNANASAVNVTPFLVSQTAVVNTNFKRYVSYDGCKTFVSNGTTPVGNLTTGVTAGDICYNGPSGQAFYYSGAAWIGM